MSVYVVIRKGEFRDSVVLMNVSRKLSDAPGIDDALVVMGTDNNKEILDDLGLLTDETRQATTEDLVIAFKSDDPDMGRLVLENIDSYFIQEVSETGIMSFSTIEAALEAEPDANLALISVPGEYAARQAKKALQKGLHTLVFSDNVPLQEEIQLKQLAEEKNLFIMGPDCGVCNIDGAALALASILGRGQVGVVGASGSGIQEITALIDKAGFGISQAIGTGGRDLHVDVGGITMLRGLRTLLDDPSTAVIVLIGKSPAPKVESQLISVIRSSTKPVITCFLNSSPDVWTKAGALFAPTMDAAAQLAIALLRGEDAAYYTFTLPQAEIKTIVENARSELKSGKKYLRGLFGGGTFAGQAQMLLKPFIDPIYSNAPAADCRKLSDPRKSIADSFIDLGDEAFTRGRAHPVIDPLPYRLRIQDEFNDPETGVILLDVILGPACHPDPAGYIADVLIDASGSKENKPIVIASVCGTRRDPQDSYLQEVKLRNAGVIVMPSSAQAALLAGLVVSDKSVEEGLSALSHLSDNYVGVRANVYSRNIVPQETKLLGAKPKIINIGVDLLADSLRAQNIGVVQVVWSPPAGGDPHAIRLLDQWDSLDIDIRERIQNANKKAFDIFVNGQPIWTDVQPAGKVISGYHSHLITHAGPAIDFRNMEINFKNGVIGAALIEGLAENREEAKALLEKGEIELQPAWDFNVPIAGMSAVSYSMPVMVAVDIVHGTMGFSPIMEGPSFEALRSGVYNEVVAKRWDWFRESLGPILSKALKNVNGINLRNVVSRSLLMGDENHSRETASTLIILAELAPHLALLDIERSELSRCLDFIRSAERFSQNVLIAGAAAVLKAAENIKYSTVVTGMGGNGVEMGVKISALGSRMFTAPAPIIYGRFLNPSTKIEDTVPFAGDSCAVTVYGLGGCAAAASPAVTLLGGGTVQDAYNRTREMWEITIGKNPNYAIPTLSFEGTPTAFDVIKILETGILPASHAGIIHKTGGMAGAGIARIPMECFVQALDAFFNELEE